MCHLNILSFIAYIQNNGVAGGIFGGGRHAAQQLNQKSLVERLSVSESGKS